MLEAYEHQIAHVSLIPSRGGAYEVVVDGELLYSKKATGKHVEPDEVIALIKKKLS